MKNHNIKTQRSHKLQPIQLQLLFTTPESKNRNLKTPCQRCTKLQPIQLQLLFSTPVSKCTNISQVLGDAIPTDWKLSRLLPQMRICSTSDQRYHRRCHCNSCFWNQHMCLQIRTTAVAKHAASQILTWTVSAMMATMKIHPNKSYCNKTPLNGWQENSR